MKNHADALRAQYAVWQQLAGETADVPNSLLVAARPLIAASVRRALSTRHALIVDDVVNEALIYVWQHLGRCRRDPVAWCRRIARSKALDSIRARRKLPDPLPDVEECPITTEGHPPVSIDYGALSEIEQQVLTLLMEGYSLREVSDMFRLTRVEMNAAIESIRANVNNHAEISQSS